MRGQERRQATHSDRDTHRHSSLGSGSGLGLRAAPPLFNNP